MFKNLLYKCALEVRTNYLRDMLKAPMACDAKPAFFSKPSVNVYFGTNKRDNGTTMERASYGFGKGRGSIGLNPVTMTIYPPFESLLQLMDKVTKVVRENPEWNLQLGTNSFNSCSIKIYYKYHDVKRKIVSKTTEWHVDVTRDSEGAALDDNSQVPGTPVATLTFGDAKNLWMRRHRTKKLSINDSVILFRQRNGSFFVLDANDEKHNKQDGMHWRHKSNLPREAKDGVTFSFMFRAVQMSTEVQKGSCLLADPRVGPSKRLQFLKGERHFTTKHYSDQMESTEAKLNKCFIDFKP